MGLVSGRAQALTVIAPETVGPGGGYSITISSQAHETGILSLSDGVRPLADIEFVTDDAGIFVYRDIAPAREGLLTYLIVLNASGSWSGSIAVSAPLCTTANAPSCLGFLRVDLLTLTADLAFLIALVLLAVNLPTLAMSIARYQKEAAMRGGPTVSELAKTPFALNWTILSPAKQILATMPTERVAIELKRRQAIVDLVNVARYARKFEYERHVALVLATRRVVDLYNLERGVTNRKDKEKTEAA